MNDTRDLLRQAAEDFALRIYEIIRADLSSQLGSQPPPAAPIASNADAPLDKVVAFVAQHPGAMPKDIVAESRLSRPTVFKALATACSTGLLHKRGGGRTVQYFTAPTDTTPAAKSPEPTRRRRSASNVQDVSADVAAFVIANPGCRYSELRDATGASTSILQRALRDAKERGAIRMEGVRINARYYPLAPSSAPNGARALPQPATEAPARAESTLRKLDEALAREMHPIRLGAVLQALVAQIRELQEQTSAADPLSPALDRAIRRITAIRADRELPFITGLKRGATADWPALAQRAWARVEAFDRDAEEAALALAPRPKATSTKPQRQPTEAADPVDLFPSLQHAADKLPLVLVGGAPKDETLAQIESRYGLSVEWTAAQGADPLAVEAFLERVKHGKLAAVVVLEGMFRHSHVLPIVQALKAHKVPFAYGDRAEAESLRRAFAELEHTLLERTSTAG